MTAAALVHEMFEEQALRRPDATALESVEACVTYGELNRRAEEVAAALRGVGVGPDVRVGLLSPRSPELFAGILGVLKAGGAYFCLDPEYPRERLLRIWEDLGAAVLLASREMLDWLPSRGATRLPLEPQRGASGTPARGDLNGGSAGARGRGRVGKGRPPRTRRAAADDLAYVIFTSGSTGRPKGILLEHRGLVNLTRWTIAALGLGPGDRLLQFAALSFDVSVWETFMALGSGATLVLPGPSDRFLAPALRAILRERRVTAALLPPSLMALLPAEDLPDLRAVVSVGERLSNEVASRWSKGRRLVNGYGPAEASITASAFEVRPDGDYPGQGPPIGKPIPGVRIHVLGGDLRPVPAGEPGEMFIGGVGVARGYIGLPRLDREKFLPDPFSGGRGRMYRTGDLARQLPDGNLEFLGRGDHQVKVRGVRVELGEVEAVLRRHPGVREAVALAREGRGGCRLLAFVASAQPESPTPGDLKRHVQKALPRAMVPAEYFVLRDLPRTPNGKLDRAGLAAMAAEDAPFQRALLAGASPPGPQGGGRRG